MSSGVEDEHLHPFLTQRVTALFQQSCVSSSFLLYFLYIFGNIDTQIHL